MLQTAQFPTLEGSVVMSQYFPQRIEWDLFDYLVMPFVG